MRELISLHIGQAGIGIGSEQWSLYCQEHGINFDGATQMTDSSITPLFYETTNGKHVPRSIFVDTDPDSLTPLKRSNLRILFHPDFLIHGKEDCSSNFAQAYYSLDRGFKDNIKDQIRKLAEKSDSLAGFIFNHSISGGTGAGLTTLLLNSIGGEYNKTFKQTVSIFPSNRYSDVIVAPYNAILALSELVEFSDLTFMMDNLSLCNHLSKFRNADSLTDINKHISQIVSSITACNRYQGSGLDLNTLLTNLIPYSRLHFVTVSHAKAETVSQLTDLVFDNNYATLDCNPFEGKFLSCALVYRASPMSEIEETIAKLQMRSFSFSVAKCVKYGNVNKKLEGNMQSCTLINHNCSVVTLFQKLKRLWDRLFSKRSHVHYYIWHGLNSREMRERYDIFLGLIEDYIDVNKENFP